MSSHVCNQCARTYEYTTDKGYSREFCSATCDYSFIIDQLRKENEKLHAALKDIGRTVQARVSLATKGGRP